MVVRRPRLVESHCVEAKDDFMRDVERMEKEDAVAPLDTSELIKGDGEEFNFDAMLDEARARLDARDKKALEA